MRIMMIGLAFAIALLAVMAFVFAGSSGTAEASIDPIVESECAAQDSSSDNSGSTGPDGKTAGNGQHPPGQNPGGPGEGDLQGVRNANDNAASGQGTAHCKDDPNAP